MPKTALLPVTITDTEKLTILAEVSVMLTEVEALTAEKKRLPEAIKTLLGSIHMKNHALAAGVIEREVEIREEGTAFNARVKVFRVDTGEFVRERGMDPEEAQMQLGQSSVPGPTPDNVRSLAEHREESEEQLAAGSPEEAELLRQARLADEAEQRILDVIAGLSIEVVDREDGTFVARVAGDIPGVSAAGLSGPIRMSAAGLSGPIRETAEAARADLVDEVMRLVMGVPATVADEAVRAAELQELALAQAIDEAATKPKRGLKVPKGAKGRRTKKVNPDAPDTTPPTDDGAPLAF